MASKLHRRGMAPGEAVAWEPPSKGGIQPRNVAASPSPGMQLTPQDLEGRIRELERELAERTQAAYQRGINEGQNAGRQQATAQFQAALDQLARTVQEITSTKPRLRHEAEEDIVKLALAIARRILYREINTDPAGLLGLVRAALDKQ